jgi:hypothetical protein
MGVFEWVKTRTGAWGPVLLDFYLQNAWWINSIVVAYGFLLLLSWQNLSRMSDELVGQILEQAKRMEAGKKKSRKHRLVRLSDFQLSWERAFASGKFPFVAKGSGFVIRRSNPQNIHAMISDRDLIRLSSRRLNEMGFRLEGS